MRQIDRNNYNACIELKISKEQQKFVSSNVYSLAQAAYEPNLYPLGVYRDEDMVGFLLYYFDDEISEWSMLRFMIDEKFQHQGIGKITVKKFIEYMIDKHGHIKLYTSADIDNISAINLYTNIGFKKKDVFEYEYNGVIHKEFKMEYQL